MVLFDGSMQAAQHRRITLLRKIIIRVNLRNTLKNSEPLQEDARIGLRISLQTIVGRRTEMDFAEEKTLVT
jgi:hypothetical protein